MTRDWKPSDTLQLCLLMQVRVLKGYETPYLQIPCFKKSRAISQLEDVHNPHTTAYYGPLLFSFPIPAQSLNNEVPGINSNYAIDVNGTMSGPS